MTVTTDEFAEELQTLGPDALAILRAVLVMTRNLEPDQVTPFLAECLAALDGDQTPRPASEVLAPVLARWAGQVQS